jgi:hypothetical protein
MAMPEPNPGNVSTQKEHAWLRIAQALWKATQVLLVVATLVWTIMQIAHSL